MQKQTVVEIYNDTYQDVLRYVVKQLLSNGASEKSDSKHLRPSLKKLIKDSQ